MRLSYWEKTTWFDQVDFTVIGSGIVGLSCALQLKTRFPNAKVLVLERGILPQGASTKNAGFACFGSLSEILEDLKHHSEQEVFNLVKLRYEGLKLLRETLGDSAIDYQCHGGHELFLNSQQTLLDTCLDGMDQVNALLRPVFNAPAFHTTANTFHFNNVLGTYLVTPFEGQIDTGKMMSSLLQKVISKGVFVLNSFEVEGITDLGNKVLIKTKEFEFFSSHVCIATNGFASQFLEEDIKPARAQVLITKPIENLPLKGTFHLDKGYYYFRNIHNRILFGGGRNLDFNAEQTTAFGLTDLVQKHLEQLLKGVILPGIPFEIERRWSGIMGIGSQKKVLVKPISERVYCGVRLGGMGIAIGSMVGKQLADLLD